MKTFIIAVVTCLGLTGFSFGGDCTSGFCSRPVGRVLSTTKTVTREVVRLPVKVVTKCVNGRCHRVR